LVFICCCLAGAFFCRAGWGGETWTIVKMVGVPIVMPSYASGDVLVVEGELLEYEDWRSIQSERNTNPFHLRLLNGEVVIPEEALAGCYALLSVTSPTVRHVEENAFSSCSALRSFDFPNLVSMDYAGFMSCHSLVSVELPASLGTVYNPFFGCGRLEEIRVAAENAWFKSIDGVLYNLDGKRLLSYPMAKKGAEFVGTRLEEVDATAFFANRNLRHVYLPMLEIVNEHTFYHARNLVSVEIPRVKEIDLGAFFFCTSLKEVRVLFLETISDHAFKNCESLEFFNAPRLKNIGIEAFVECRALKTVSCPQALNVGLGAFGSCDTLVSLDLRNIEEIWRSAFYDCVSLRELRLGRPPVVEEGAFSGVPGPLVLRVPEEVVGEYTAAYLEKSGYPAGTRVVAAED